MPAAIFADAIGPVEPRYPNPVATFKAMGVRPGALDHAAMVAQTSLAARRLRADRGPLSAIMATDSERRT